MDIMTSPVMILATKKIYDNQSLQTWFQQGKPSYFIVGFVVHFAKNAKGGFCEYFDLYCSKHPTSLGLMVCWHNKLQVKGGMYAVCIYSNACCAVFGRIMQKCANDSKSFESLECMIMSILFMSDSSCG